MSTSFVATIKIEKVNKTEARGTTPPQRDVVEATNLVIKASSFTRLQEKVQAHVSILEEEDL